MSPVVPIGPFHPALEEPYKVEVTCEGERITDASVVVGFNFRGIEWLAERKSYTQDIALLERVCGICSNVHTLMFSRAVEKIAGLEVPDRAQYIRVVIAEAERLHSHLLWAGVACNLIGFETLFMTCFSLREQVMDILERISGNRVNYAMNRPGGVNRDISDPGAVLAAVRTIEKTTSGKLIPIMTGDPTVRARCAGVGVLSRDDALAHGAVGPLARASGLTQDIRRSAPYEAYDKLDFDVPVRDEGDVLARIVVRASEILQSCRLIEQAVETMPAGPIGGPLYPSVPAGEASVRVEAPRGEVFYYLASDGTDVPVRVRVRTPTFVNMPTVPLMAVGESISDLPLIQASIDPCYSCNDR
ncbi:nickel-dependent hydrogenase large subunit [Streptomyces cavernae]|uniref:hydrogenase large subunit n=1 Tax=Streptomyces cavernae TaxID=2259034 RepID=UPI000FEC056A|nr:nickel-dependent hydrogenase large subunit [Streptomyces cavernae]